MASASAAFALDINDIKPGELQGLIEEESLTGSSLVVSGAIDARDLAAMEHLPSTLTTLDLSKANINPLTVSTRKYFGKTLFAEGELPGYTFFKSGLSTLVLPTNIKTIGDGAFSASSLQSIEIPEGVESIGDYAFYGCPDLKSVKLPSTLKTIGKGAFGNCHNLKSVTFSASSQISELPERTFAGCVQLASISLPSTIIKIGKEAFTHTMISELNLNNVQEFEAFALSGMPYLEQLQINPEAADNAYGLLMDDISLVSLSGVPQNLPDYFTANCTALPTNIVMSDAGTIGKYALANQNGSEWVLLGENLKSLQRGAISGTHLRSIDAIALENNIPEVDETTFEGIDQPSVVLVVTDTSYEDWIAHPIWSLFDVQKSSETAVGNNISEGVTNIKISLGGGFLTIISGSELTDVKIFSTDGKLLYSATPGTSELQIPLTDITSGVAIVKATNANKETKTITLML